MERFSKSVRPGNSIAIGCVRMAEAEEIAQPTKKGNTQSKQNAVKEGGVLILWVSLKKERIED